jgi:hypothetical protein
MHVHIRENRLMSHNLHTQALVRLANRRGLYLNRRGNGYLERRGDRRIDVLGV